MFKLARESSRVLISVYAISVHAKITLSRETVSQNETWKQLTRMNTVPKELNSTAHCRVHSSRHTLLRSRSVDATLQPKSEVVGFKWRGSVGRLFVVYRVLQPSRRNFYRGQSDPIACACSARVTPSAQPLLRDSHENNCSQRTVASRTSPLTSSYECHMSRVLYE